MMLYYHVSRRLSTGVLWGRQSHENGVEKGLLLAPSVPPPQKVPGPPCKDTDAYELREELEGRKRVQPSILRLVDHTAAQKM